MDAEVIDPMVNALEKANAEFKDLYTKGTKYIKATEDRVSAVKMIMMRARDIAREVGKDSAPSFTFTITAFNLDDRRWDKCPGCGDPDINQQSASGHPWQGCYKCRVLLGSNGTIKSMGAKG